MAVERAERRRRVEHHRRLAAVRADVLHDRVQVRAGLLVHRDVGRAGLREVADVALGLVIIRWTSSGSVVARRIAATTGGPMVRLGTKWPSMTSTWIQSAPASSTARTSSPSRPKSAARIDAAMRCHAPDHMRAAG